LEYVVVGQVEADGVREVAAALVFPLAVALVQLDDDADFRRLVADVIGGRRSDAARRLQALRVRAGAVHGEAVADHAFADGGGLVAGGEDRGEDAVAGGRQALLDGEAARRIAEHGHDLQRDPADRAAEARRIEDPYVGAIHAGRRELRIAGAGDGRDRRIRALL